MACLGPCKSCRIFKLNRNRHQGWESGGGSSLDLPGWPDAWSRQVWVLTGPWAIYLPCFLVCEMAFIFLRAPGAAVRILGAKGGEALLGGPLTEDPLHSAPVLAPGV